MHPRARLKRVLWLGDLKASLINCVAITRRLMYLDQIPIVELFSYIWTAELLGAGE